MNAPGKQFEDLEVWKDAVELAAAVFACFRNCSDRDFKNQIQRAAVSVSSNIAEGYERGSDPDFVRFLFIAKASCGEVRSQAHVAQRVALLPAEACSALVARASVLSRRLHKLIQARRGFAG